LLIFVKSNGQTQCLNSSPNTIRTAEPRPLNEYYLIKNIYKILEFSRIFKLGVTNSRSMCVIDNKRNVERNRGEECNTIDDDCGVWSSSAGRTLQIPYIEQTDRQLKRT